MQAGFVEHVLKQTLLVWLVCPCWQVTVQFFVSLYIYYWCQNHCKGNFTGMSTGKRHGCRSNSCHGSKASSDNWCHERKTLSDLSWWLHFHIKWSLARCLILYLSVLFLLSSNKTRCIYDLSTMEIVCFCIEFESKNVQVVILPGIVYAMPWV